MRALTLTLLATILPLFVAALLLGAYLNYASVRSMYVNLVSDRLEASARRVATDAQTALSMGLPLAGQVALSRTAEREVAVDRAVGQLDVLDPRGVVLFSSNPDAVGEPAAAPGALGSIEAPIGSAFGTLEGAAVTRADATQISMTLSTLFGGIARASIVALVVAGAAIAIIIAVLVRILAMRLLRTGRMASGHVVPTEAVAVFDAVDTAHDALEATLADLEAKVSEAHAPA